MVRCKRYDGQHYLGNPSFLQNNKAISTIIGTILMVMLLIVIASVVYISVQSMVDEKPKKIVALFDAEYTISNGELIIQHLSGDTLPNAVQPTEKKGETKSGWWDQPWKRRIPVNIQSNTAIPTEKQYQIDISYDKNMKSDFSDIRFIDSDGSQLSYWTENIDTASSASFWVRIPSLPSGEKTIYVYYGNQHAVSSSNPDETFPVFVNFTRDGVISYGGSNQDRDPSQWEILPGNVLRMWGNNWKAVLRDVSCHGDGSQSIDFSFKSTGAQAEINGIGLDTDGSISSNRFYRIYGTQGWGRNDHIGYTPDGSWQSYSLILNDFSAEMNRFVITNDADHGQNTNVYYKNLRLRSYTPVNPDINVFYDQEQIISSHSNLADYELKNLEVRVNNHPIVFDSIEVSSTDLFAGDSITISFNASNKPEKGDTITIRYVPTNQLIYMEKIM